MEEDLLGTNERKAKRQHGCRKEKDGNGSEEMGGVGDLAYILLMIHCFHGNPL